MGWKLWTRDFKLFIRAKDIDVMSGMRENIDQLQEIAESKRARESWKGAPLRAVRALF